MIDKSRFKSKEDLFRFLKENKSQLVSEKKFEMKRADAVFFAAHSINEKGEAEKEEAENVQSLLLKDRITVRAVINTTKLLDSHEDVHIDGLWKKSIKELKSVYHLQEHQMKFDHVISDEVKASTKKMSWKDLGAELPGDTEALLFDSQIEKSRNPFMFDQYVRGYVKNHSVGMRYVQLSLCINSSEKYYREEKDNWDKYIVEVANKEDAENNGYFWAVTEAKLIEGSAVLRGSNWATPTQSVKETEPPLDTLYDGPDTPPAKTMFGKFNQLKNLEVK
jgi:hypothetical protein